MADQRRPKGPERILAKLPFDGIWSRLDRLIAYLYDGAQMGFRLAADYAGACAVNRYYV
jgi:hypothetical protein